MIHTGYSFRHAVGTIPEVISRLKEIGWTVAPVSDRTSTFSFVKWERAAKEAGLRPVYGVSLGVVRRLEDKLPSLDWWRFLAKTSLTPLHDLIYEATKISSAPYLTYDSVRHLPGLTAIAGSSVCLDMAEPRDDLYVAMSPSTPRGLYLDAKRRGHRFVAVPDNCYPRRDDLSMYYAVTGWRGSSQTYPRHVVGDAELRQACWYASDAEFSDAVALRERVLDSCRAEIVHGTLLKPTTETTLRAMCEAGAKIRGCDLSDPVYSARLERELAVIEEKRFEDYFFIVSDALRWARQRMICGPGRGSSSGSLVCWLLEITDVDPIKFDLVFERFIDITRPDYPDIDVDLSEERRDMMFEYLRERYGREKVARLATVLLFQSKSALNTVGAAIGVPRWMIEETVNSVVTRSKGDSRADSKISDTLGATTAGKRLVEAFPEMTLAGRIEQHPVTSGQHSAGVVMTNTSVRDFVGVIAHSNVAMCDWQDAKDVNLIKIDMLGLTQLSIFERCLEMIGVREGGKFLQQLPLDDAGALDVLNRRHLSGIFQFQGATTRQVVHQLDRVESFEDVVSLTSLCRPGPLGSGGTQSWINRKNGVEKVEVAHPAFLPYLEKTMGIMIYQEQVMRICREIGGMSWSDVTSLRKAMGKSLGMEYFDSYRDKFLPGAASRGVPEEAALEMWDRMCSFGMYGFNRSHAVAYALITYWCCWLKAHHPVEFAAATLDSEHDPVKSIEILRELRDEGVDYVACDPEVSTNQWAVAERGGRKILVGPLSMIKGIGPKTVMKILEARAEGKPLPPGVMKKMERVVTEIDSLNPVSDALQRLYPDLSRAQISSRLTMIDQVFSTMAGRRVVIVGVVVKNHPLNENEPGRIARRGYKILRGPLQALNFHLRDDSGDIFCKVGRWRYRECGPVLEEARAGKSLFAVAGNVPLDFRMVWVEQVKYLGEIDGEERRRDDAGDASVARRDGSSDGADVRQDLEAAPS